MKKVITLSLITLNILFANEFSVEKSKEFSIEATPTIMETTFSISKHFMSYNSIQKTFNEIVEDIKKEQICKGGQYSISPHYNWDKNKRVFDGYDGRVSFKCQFKASDEFNKILKNIDNKAIEFSLSPIQWKIEDKEQTILERSVEKQALHYVKDEAKFLSHELNASCKITNISFNKSNQFNPQPMAYAEQNLMMSKSITTSPIKENLKITQKVAYKFSCTN